MGLFDGLKSKKETYPALDPSGATAGQIRENQESLGSLAQRAKARMEVVPAADTLYVYIGKPPKDFGIVWYADGEEHTFMAAMSARGLSNAQIQQVSDDLRDVYVTYQEEPRFSFAVDGESIVVTPSPSFAADIERVLSMAT